MADGIIARLPPWFQDDLLVKAFNDEIERIKLEKYYDALSKHVIQPIQVWREITSLDTDGTPLENTLYGRIITTETFPIEEVSLHDEEGNTLYRERYRKQLKKTRTTISCDDLIEKFYVKVKYYGIGASKQVGFPQVVDITSVKLGILNVILKDDEQIIELDLDFSYVDDTYTLTIDNKITTETFTNIDIYTLIRDVNDNSEFVITEFYSEGEIDDPVSGTLKVIDPVYTASDSLSEIAISYGVERRKYRNDITVLEALTAYPSGYTYEDEQDYYLEKRLISEYGIQEQAEEVNLTLIHVKIKENVYEPKTLHLTLYSDDTGYNLLIEDDNIDKITRTEFYTKTTVEELIESINTNSKWVTAHFNQNTTLTDSVIGTITQTGMVERFGILRTGIYHKVGVIPTIADMPFYLLKYNIDNWNQKWLGVDGIYSPAVFFVEIPIHDIPSNFIIPSMDELQLICDKSKLFGTYAIPEYVVYSETNMLFDDPYYHIPTYYYGTLLEPMELQSELTSIIEGHMDGETFVEDYENVRKKLNPIKISSELTNLDSRFTGTSIAHAVFNAPTFSIAELSSIIIHNTQADFNTDTLNELVANSDNTVTIDLNQKERLINPSSVTTSGTGLSWTNISYIIDANTNNYAESDVGVGSSSKNPSSQSQGGTGGLAWLNPANSADSSDTTYALSASRTESSDYTNFEASRTQENITYPGMPSTNNWGFDATSPPLSAVEVSDSSGVIGNTSPSGGYDTTNFLRVRNFDFNVPSNATITGVKVAVKRRIAGTVSFTDKMIKLCYNGSRTGDDKATSAKWPNSYATVYYGDIDDDWSASLTPSKVNSSTFGVDISGVNNSSYSVSAYIDYVAVKVYYTISSTETATNYLNLSGLSYTIPSGSSVVGYEVEVKSYCSSASKRLEVSIVNGSTTKTKTATMPTSAGTITFGDGTDMWGGLPSSVSSLSLKLRSLTYYTARIYYVTVKVYYSTALVDTQYLEFNNLDFNIPSGSEVTGVSSVVKCHGPNGDETLTASLTAGGDLNTKTDTLPSTAGNVTLGGASDLWTDLGETPANYDDVDFKIKVTSTGQKCKIYTVAVSVYYHNLAGTLTSNTITAPVVNQGKWDSLEVSEIDVEDTSITWDVLQASNSAVLLSSQTGPNIRLTNIPYVNIKVRANMSATAFGSTPILNEFIVIARSITGGTT